MIDPGRALKPVTTLAAGEDNHVLPFPLPGGRVLLYTVRKSAILWGGEAVVALTLANGQRTPVLADAADARYVPSGHLVFLRRGTLMAVAFNPERLDTLGEPQIALDSVAQALTGDSSYDTTGAGQYAIAPDGALAYVRSPVVEYPSLSRERDSLPLPLRGYGGQPSRVTEFADVWLANRSSPRRSAHPQASEGWRRGWDSDSVRLFRICKLQKPRCRDYRRCHACRRALPAIAR